MPRRRDGIRTGVVFAFALILGPAGVNRAAADTVELTGIKVFGADPTTGAPNGSPWYSTSPGTNSLELFLTAANSGPLGPLVSSAGPIDLPLTSGTSTYYLYGNGDTSGQSAWGLNLYFGGNTATPSITAVTPTQVSASKIPMFQADTAGSTPGLDSAVMAGSPGALSFTTADGNVVTLAAYSWAASSVYGLDRVSSMAGTPDGMLDQVGFIAITVTPAPPIGAVPEPSTIALMGLGLAGLGLRLVRLRRRAEG